MEKKITFIVKKIQKKTHYFNFFGSAYYLYIESRRNNDLLNPNEIMLIDRTTNRTYSSGSAAIRELGKKEFNNKVKRNELDYVKCSFVK